MPTITIKMTLKQYGERYAALGSKFVEVAKRGCLSAALKAVVTLQASTRGEAPRVGVPAVDTGRYLRSWTAAPTEYGAVVTNTAPYAGVIERGRRRGARKPPIQVLAEWAQRRLGLSREDAQRAAHAIARKIQRDGIKGKYVMKRARDKIAADAVEEVRKELERELAKPPVTPP